MTELSIAWRTDLAEDDQREIRALIAAAKKHDGIAPVGDQVLRELSHDRTRHLVATDSDGIAGYLDLAPAARLLLHGRIYTRIIASLVPG